MSLAGYITGGICGSGGSLSELASGGLYGGGAPPVVVVPDECRILAPACGSGPFAGNFPATIPGTELDYTIDFVDQIAVKLVQGATVGGAVTPGDTVGIKFIGLALSGGEISIFYIPVLGDDAAAIASALNARINGNQELVAAGYSSSIVGGAIAIEYNPLPVTAFEAVLFPVAGNLYASETVFFAAGTDEGETITSATVTCDIFTGGTDPDPSSRIVGSAIISGSKVTTVAGNFVAGNVYRLYFDVVTPSQPAIKLYAHIECGLPQ